MGEQDIQLYNPKRVLRLVEQNLKTVLLDESGVPVSTPLAKALRAEASDLLTTKLFGMMLETMRADAVEKGIVNYMVPEHAMFAKAIWHVTSLLEQTVKEIAALKTE